MTRRWQQAAGRGSGLMRRWSRARHPAVFGPNLQGFPAVQTDRHSIVVFPACLPPLASLHVILTTPPAQREVNDHDGDCLYGTVQTQLSLVQCNNPAIETMLRHWQ